MFAKMVTEVINKTTSVLTVAVNSLNTLKQNEATAMRPEKLA
jgi:hypothetical protein